MKAAELYDLAKIMLPGITKRMFSTFYSQAMEELSQTIRLSVPTVVYDDDSFATLPLDIVRIEKVLSDEIHGWKIENNELYFYDSSGDVVDSVSGLTITYWERIRNAIVSPHLFTPAIYTATIDADTHEVGFDVDNNGKQIVTLDPIIHSSEDEELVAVIIYASEDTAETTGNLIVPITGITTDKFNDSNGNTDAVGSSGILIRYYEKDTSINMTAPLTLVGATPPDIGSFVEWVDIDGVTLTTDPTLTITADAHMAVFAVYDTASITECVVSINANLADQATYPVVLLTGMPVDNTGSGVNETTSGDDTAITRTYNSGTTFTVTAPLVAEQGVVFNRWLVDGLAVSSTPSLSLSVEITANTTVSAEYVTVPAIIIEDEDGNEITTLAFEYYGTETTEPKTYYVRGLWLTNDISIVPDDASIEISLNGTDYITFEGTPLTIDKATANAGKTVIYARYTDSGV